MTVNVIRYKTGTEHAAENERLIRAVFAELAEHRPEGLRYAAIRLEDGVTFVHIAEIGEGGNPLMSSEAFSAFQVGIADRCADGPATSVGEVIGTYRLPLV
jgi:hypothetical protein